MNALNFVELIWASHMFSLYVVHVSLHYRTPSLAVSRCLCCNVKNGCDKRRLATPAKFVKLVPNPSTCAHSLRFVFEGSPLTHFGVCKTFHGCGKRGEQGKSGEMGAILVLVSTSRAFLRERL